ncbi:MAG: polyphenol oxidase family protein [Candidatus Brocadiia bacterium]
MQAIVERSGKRFVVSELANELGVGWAMTTRDLAYDSEDGDTAVKSLSERATRALDISEMRFVSGRQVHGSGIFVSGRGGAAAASGRFLRVPETDGLATNSPMEVLGILTADCSSVALIPKGTDFIGIAHSGWRSTASNIAPKLVRTLTDLSGVGASDMSAIIGPMILGDCYEVGMEVVDTLGKACGGAFAVPGRPGAEGKFILDLPGYIKLQLLAQGIIEKNIEMPSLCTACREDLFFSWRRSADKSRMVTLLWRQ